MGRKERSGRSVELLPTTRLTAGRELRLLQTCHDPHRATQRDSSSPHILPSLPSSPHLEISFSRWHNIGQCCDYCWLGSLLYIYPHC
jgi:hypothetical protein